MEHHSHPEGPHRRAHRAQRGQLRAAVLLLLAEQPRHGYELMAELTERSDGRWEPSAGAIYPMLRRLAGKGLVGAELSDGRKQFHLTDAGKEYVDTHRQEWGEPWAASDDTVWRRGPRPRGHEHRVELRVSGTAHATVPPDYARLHVRAVVEDPDQAAAATAINEIARSLRELDGDHAMVLSAVHVSQVFDGNEGESGRHATGWRAILTGHAEVDTDGVGLLVAQVLTGRAGIDYVTWHLRDDNPVYREVRTAAVQEAARAAEDFAHAIGRGHAGELRTLADAGLSAAMPPAQVMPMARAMAAPMPEMELDPAPQQISATVEAVYLVG